MQSISNSKRVPPLAQPGGRSYAANSDLQFTSYFSIDKIVVFSLEFFPNKTLCLLVGYGQSAQVQALKILSISIEA